MTAASVPNLLESLVAGALEDAAARRLDRPYADVERGLDRVASPLDALEFLAPGDRVKVLAEVKRASPSRGSMAPIEDPASLAADYERGGASAISVLTEGRKFLGSLADLEAVKARVSVPVLRKDFIADPYQVVEARAAGADVVLLIVAALDQPTLVEPPRSRRGASACACWSRRTRRTRSRAGSTPAPGSSV